MMKHLFVLLFFIISICGQPSLAAEDGAAESDTADSAGSGQSAGQDSTASGSEQSGSGKKPAKAGDEEPECD
jgi:hypothetical protein